LDFLAGSTTSFDTDFGEPLVVLPDGKVTCRICGRTLSNATSGKRHYINSHQPNLAATCKVCKKTFKNMQTMKGHMKRDHGISQKMMKAAVVRSATVGVILDEHNNDIIMIKQNNSENDYDDETLPLPIIEQQHQEEISQDNIIDDEEISQHDIIYDEMNQTV
jgi:hypothetical protein